MIKIYQSLMLVYRSFRASIFPQAVCRHMPSCSEYAHEAVLKHGLWNGSQLSVRRILRCHPFSQGGYDPVPEVL